MNKKKLLGIVASYRKAGNGEIVAKSVAERLGDGWELSLINLPRLRSDPCKGCYVCLLPGKKCMIKDDVEWILERFVEADAIIYTAPDYILGPVAIVKMLTDRALQTYGLHSELGKKKTAVALTLGREDYRGYADTALAAQVHGLGLNVVSLENFYGTHPGEVVLAEDYGEKIATLAESLESDTFEHKVSPNRCPRCFSDLFRIRDGYFECAVCRSKAKLEEEELRFVEFGGQFTDEGRKEHGEWLVMKKLEYMEIKDKLKVIQDRYRGGTWLKPERESN
jgi:multimeric flavodoxin WrbA